MPRNKAISIFPAVPGIALLLLLATAAAQIPALEGTWYGTVNPPGAQFEIAVSFQRKGDSWTGTLLVENSVTIALRDIVVQANAISFAVDGQNVTFKGTLPESRSEISGEFTQNNATFPFKLSRTPTAALQGAALAIDPNALIEMMTAMAPDAGPVSKRPFVPPLTHPSIGYRVSPARDPVADLLRNVQEGKIQLKFEAETGYLHAVLDALDIPVESQIAVFSKNSLQREIISPENPRLLYFNDTVAIGFIRGGFIELAAQDPEHGINFYMLWQQPETKPFFIQRDECLGCHHSRNSLDIPGMLMRGVYPSAGGTPVNPLGSYLLDHRTKFEDRWGGWFVTGNTGSMRHLGNAVVADPAQAESMTPLKDKTTSDIVALMVFQHQMHMMNLITRIGWEYRIAAFLDEATGKPNDIIQRQLRDAVNELVDYLLFVDEAPLPNKIEGTSSFAVKFAAQGPNDSKGRSLRQFDLERRLMRYPCSYMIYSPAFDALPVNARRAIYERMREVMTARLPAADREAILGILKDTKKDF